MNKHKIKITENFLDDESFNKLQDILMSDYFPWYLTGVVGGDSNFPQRTHFKNSQFSHMFYTENLVKSEFVKILDPILKKINAACLIRIKANFNWRTDKNIMHGMHVDTDYKNIVHTTAILYINNTNAYTFFEDGFKIKNKANTFIEFPSYFKHSGSSNTCETPGRIVLNLNYLKDETNNYCR